MTMIYVDSKKVKEIENNLKLIAENLAQVSSYNYVTGPLFTMSQGNAVNSYDSFLDSIVQCSNQMETILMHTCRYLEDVIEQFTFVENEFIAIFEKTKNRHTNISE